MFAVTDNQTYSQNVITGITNGLEVQKTINYQTGNSSFTNIDQRDYPIGPYRSKNLLVWQTWKTDPSGNKLNWMKYTFRSPIALKTGKGFLGYEEIVTTNYQQSTQTFTSLDVHSEIVDGETYCYYPYTDSEVVKTMGSPAITLRQAENELDAKFTITGNPLVFIPVLTNRTVKTWDNDQANTFMRTIKSVQLLSDIDEYGNITYSKSLVDEGEPATDNDYKYQTITERSFSLNDPINWLIDRPDTVKITKKVSVEPDDVSLTLYTFKPNTRLVEIKEMIPNGNDSLRVKATYVYDSFGNRTKETLSAPNYYFDSQQIDDRVIEYEYKTDDYYASRFLTARIQSKDGVIFRTENEYDPLTGRMIRQKSSDMLETSYSYSPMGKLLTVNNADGTRQIISKDWAVNEAYIPNNASFLESRFVEGAIDQSAYNSSYTFYDNLGRILRHVSFGTTGAPIFVDYEYNDKGLLEKQYEPYFLVEGKQLFTEYGYDALNRLEQTILPNGNKISTFYKGRTTESLNNALGLTKTRSVNAIGKVQQVTDPAGTIVYSYLSSGNVKQVDALGAITTMGYDGSGRQKSINEPNTGTVTTHYNPFGELMEQTDARLNTYRMEYDQLGRITEKVLQLTGERTQYIYNDTPPSSGNTGEGFGMLVQLIGPNSIEYKYEYDHLNRLKVETEIHPDDLSGQLIYSATMNYDDNLNRLSTYTYPGGYKIGYEYYTNGRLRWVTDVNDNNKKIWQSSGVNAKGQIDGYTLGNGLSTTRTYDKYGFPEEIITGNVQYLSYTFDSISGNLTKRQDNNQLFELYETFEYDDLLKSRLVSWQVNTQPKYRLSYENNGNILSRSDVNDDQIAGGYRYTSPRPHAVTQIELPEQGYLQASAPNQSISYTHFNKVSSITHTIADNVNRLVFTYGPDELRKITKYFEMGGVRGPGLKKTKHFVFGNFEEEIDENGDRRKLHYLNAEDGLFAIYVKEEKSTNTEFMTYVHKDYLGSYDKVTDNNGQLIEEFNFDPWGRRRNPQNWTYSNLPASYLFDRGYTGHEHLDEFDLINMNGRVYDPRLGRFLSPDPVLQAPENSQNYNRYSYVLNNPFKYTDPSGYRYGPHIDPVSGRPFRADPAGYGSDANDQMFGRMNDFDDGSAGMQALFSNFGDGQERLNEMYNEDKERKENEESQDGKEEVDQGEYGGTALYIITTGGLRVYVGFIDKNGTMFMLRSLVLSQGQQVLAEIVTRGGQTEDFDYHSAKHEQDVGMGIYGKEDGNSGPGEGNIATDHQYKSMEWPSLGQFGDDLRGLFTPSSPYPKGYTTMNKIGWDSVIYTQDSGNVSKSMRGAVYIQFSNDSILIDSGYWDYSAWGANAPR